jgi:hypothetical protein
MAEGKTYQEMRDDFVRRMWEYGRPPRPPAEVVEFPPKLSAEELWRRQAALDAAWQRTLDARAELDRDRAAGFHRVPGDPDYPKRRGY